MTTVTVLSKHPLPLCSDRPLPEPFCKVLAYQNNRVVAAVASEMRISLEMSLELFYEFKLFCYLCYSLKQTQAVPLRIDRFWHIFLDNPAEFDSFCMGCFGGTIEHIPLADRATGNINPTVDHAHDMFGPRIATRWQGATLCNARFKAAA